VLVLTRRPGESIMIGDEVVVTVLDVRGDVVRVGIKAPRIKAPRTVQVHREEVYQELQKANLDAASPAEGAVEALNEMLRSGGGQPRA
jgi:carbon storage regulator